MKDGKIDELAKLIFEIKRNQAGLTDSDYFYFIGLLNYLIQDEFTMKHAISYFKFLAENFDWKKLLNATNRNIDGIMYFDNEGEFLGFMYARYITYQASKIETSELCDERAKCSYSKFLQALESKTDLIWRKEKEFFRKINTKTMLIEVFHENDELKIAFLEILAKKLKINIAEYLGLFFSSLDNYWQIVLLEILEERSLLDHNQFAAAGLLDIRDTMLIEDGKVFAENSNDYFYLRSLESDNQDLQDAYVDWIKISKSSGGSGFNGIQNGELKSLANKYENIDAIYENVVSKACGRNFGKNQNWQFLKKEWFLPFMIYYKMEKSWAKALRSKASQYRPLKSLNDESNSCRLSFGNISEFFNYLLVTGAHYE